METRIASFLMEGLTHSALSSTFHVPTLIFSCALQKLLISLSTGYVISHMHPVMDSNVVALKNLHVEVLTPL